jgi:hypothetical protein
VVRPRDRAISQINHLIVIIEIPDQRTVSRDSAHGLLNIWAVGETLLLALRLISND